MRRQWTDGWMDGRTDGRDGWMDIDAGCQHS